MFMARFFIIFVVRIDRNQQVMIKKHHILYGLIAGSLLLLNGCHQKEAKEQSSRKPPIFPDYVNVSIPSNLSHVNFRIDGAKRIEAAFSISKGLLMGVSGKTYPLPFQLGHGKNRMEFRMLRFPYISIQIR